jgi:hypothetical protein
MNNPFEYIKILVTVKRNMANSVTPSTPDKKSEFRGRVVAYQDVIDEINKIEEMFLEASPPTIPGGELNGTLVVEGNGNGGSGEVQLV